MSEIDDVMAEFMDGGGESTIDVDKAMGMLSDHIHNMRMIQRAIEELNSELKDRNADLQRIVSNDIPEIMNGLNFKKITLNTGESVEVVDIVKGKVSDKPKFYQWLVDNNFGDLIKTEIDVKFKREERTRAIELGKKLEGLGFAAGLKEGIHWKTLDGFVKESLEENRDLPSDLLEVTVIQTTKVK